MIATLFAAAVTLLTTAGFWYCVVALWCAHVISESINRAAVVVRNARNEEE